MKRQITARREMIKKTVSLCLPVLLYLIVAAAVQMAFVSRGWEEARAKSMASCILAVIMIPLSYKIMEKAPREGCAVGYAFIAVLVGGLLSVISLSVDYAPVIRSPEMVIGAGLAGPFAEEFIYRGIVLGRGRRFLGNAGALILSTVLFAVAHVSLTRIIMALIAGAAYAVLYLKSQRLLISTLAHMTTNLLTLFLPGDLVSFWMVPVSVICLTACLLIVTCADPRKPGG